MSLLVKKVIVTAALPYANAKLHLGHLRSTYLPSDIYTRYLRLKGFDVLYVCATDEHGTPIAVRAETEGKTPKEIVDYYSPLIREDLERLGCSFNIFARTTYLFHYQLTQNFFRRLLERGYIYGAEYEQLYCPRCERFLPDRYVEGTCPYCGAEGARGDACDICGRYLKPTDLKNPYCVVCKGTPKIQKTKHWFFKLSSFQTFLKDWIEKGNFPPNVKNYALQWIREGLKDWCITRDLKWGVPIPIEEVKNKVIYVWFDAPIGYISSTREWAKNFGKPQAWKDYWQNKECSLIHFIGKDIVYHHALFWPAMLKAHGDFNLPTNIIAGEYLTLEGKKMSKSRGWVVEISEYLENFEPDPLRYYLTAIAPLDKDADFSWREYTRKHNDELADILGNFIHRSLMFTYNYFNKRIPKPGELDKYDEEILEEIRKIHGKVDNDLRNFNFNVALKGVIKLAAIGNKYLNDKQPWKTIKEEPEKAATCIYVTDQIVKALAILLEPFLPYSAEKLWTCLNLPRTVHNQSWDEAIQKIPAGHEISKPKPLFLKLEAKTMEIQKKILNERLKTGSKAMEVKKANIIPMEDFSKLDLKIGKIIKVERIPGSDKLYKLKIDVGGGEIRQAVAGLVPYYSPKQLDDKLVAVITNLKPTKIFGVESEVMILAAEDESTVTILQPEKTVKTGSKIK